MLRPIAKRISLAAWLLLSLGGCVSYAPTDLSFVSVEHEGEIDETSSAPQFLIVGFTSRTDLANFAADRSSSVGATGFFCGMSEDRVLLLDPTVYRDGRRLEVRTDGLPTAAQKTSTLRYQVLLTVSRNETQAAKPPQKSFDLRQEPKDVCFYLRGGNMVGFRYRSNVVKVPKAAIEAAFQSPPVTTP